MLYEEELVFPKRFHFCQRTSGLRTELREKNSRPVSVQFVLFQRGNSLASWDLVTRVSPKTESQEPVAGIFFPQQGMFIDEGVCQITSTDRTEILN